MRDLLRYQKCGVWTESEKWVPFSPYLKVPAYVFIAFYYPNNVFFWVIDKQIQGCLTSFLYFIYLILVSARSYHDFVIAVLLFMFALCRTLLSDFHYCDANIHGLSVELFGLYSQHCGGSLKCTHVPLS